MNQIPFGPEEIVKRMEDVPAVLEWSRNKHLTVSGPDCFGAHHIFIDNSLKHYVVLLKADLTTHLFVGTPTGAYDWKKYDEKMKVVLSQKIEPSSLEWKIYHDYILYKGDMLPPKKNIEEPYFGEVVQVEDLRSVDIDDDWVVDKIRELYK